MIAASGVLVLVAFATLVVGIFQPGLGLIYVSIASSVAAAITLATGVVKTRPKAVAVGAETLGTWSTPASALPEPEPEPDEAPVTSVLTLDERTDEDEEEPSYGGAIVEAPAPRARKAPAKKAAKAPAKKAAAGSSARVVVIPGRDKFHKSSCRYAQGEATQTITKATAKKEGYIACGVCKP